MSVKEELEAAARAWYKSIADKDYTTTIDTLAEDGNWFDYAPHRYEGQAAYKDFFYKVMEPMDRVDCNLHQVHVRVLGDHLGVVTGFDDLSATCKDGKPDVAVNGRSSMIFSKESGEWKMVHGHFSMLSPQAAAQS